MKILLGLSLIMNILLGILYFQEKNKPPLERIVIEEKTQVVHDRTLPIPGQPPQAPQLKKTKKSSKDNGIFDPVLVTDEQSFIQAADELSEAQHEIVEKLELSEEVMKSKDKLMQDYFKKTNEIYMKNPTSTSFQDRRALIELEENLHGNLEKLFGKSKWQRYKKSVDDYNAKLLQSQRENGQPGLMMSY